MRVVTPVSHFEAFQVSLTNQEELARWTKGSIRGTSLPVRDRTVQFYTWNGEQDANVGNWIVRWGSRSGRQYFIVMDERDFRNCFDER